MIDLYTNGSNHQTAGMQFLQEGLRRLGHSSALYNMGCTRGKGETCVTWGTRHHDKMTRYGKRVVMEAGYFNDRFKYYSLGKGGLNGRANFNNEDSPSDRWCKHGVPRQPWRRSGGEYIVVMGQVPGDMATAGVDLRGWYDGMIEQLHELTDTPIIFRPHPLCQHGTPTPGECMVYAGYPLQDILRNAIAVVTYNSNTGVDAAVAGVPVYAADHGSMAWPIAAHTISELVNFRFPDRCQWLYNLAYTQWTAEELKKGKAWSHLCHKPENVIEMKRADLTRSRSH